MQVWKYTIHPEALPSMHTVPEGAKVVHVGLDPKGDWCVWAEVDAGAGERTVRKWTVVGTGHEIPDTWEYLGSWAEPPVYVWHMYEVK